MDSLGAVDEVELGKLQDLFNLRCINRNLLCELHPYVLLVEWSTSRMTDRPTPTASLLVVALVLVVLVVFATTPRVFVACVRLWWPAGDIITSGCCVCGPVAMRGLMLLLYLGSKVPSRTATTAWLECTCTWSQLRAAKQLIHYVVAIRLSKLGATRTNKFVTCTARTGTPSGTALG